MKPAILLIEDDAGVAALIQAVLSRSGQLVVQAQTGPEAIRLAGMHRDRIALILSDVMLEHESCQRTIGELREACPSARVLLLSGYPLDILLERRLLDSAMFESESTVFLQKPFLPKDLLQHVQSLVPVHEMEGVAIDRADGVARYAAH
jgi:CheY-like chemotaxis protein